MREICRKVWVLFLLVIFFLCISLSGCATKPLSPERKRFGASEIVKIETRPKVTEQFILIRPSNPVASVILFAAGRGKLELGSFAGKPTLGRGDNFLVRTRKDFAEQGLVVAVLDVPSDHKARGINSLFRISVEHVQDIKAVVSYLKKKANLPIYLVGSGEGTFSAANGAINIGEEIGGLILASSLTRTPKNWKMHRSYPRGILNLDLDRITVPTLVVSHKQDICGFSPPADAAEIEEALVNSRRAEVKYFTGGKVPDLEPCYPQTAHGFYGVEKQVVSAIADFIKSK